MNARKMTVWMGMMAAMLLAAGSAQAAIIGTTGAGFATITFDDTNSLTPTLIAGTTNVTFNQPNWTGSSFTMPTQTDGNTGDFAKGNLQGTWSSTPGNPPYAYGVSLNSVLLNQVAPNTGYANLALSFSIQYLLDSSGLPQQATHFPNFTVNGTVQNGGTGFASMSGFINYYGMDSTYTQYLLDTVTYPATNWTLPGPFNGTVSGVSANIQTPALPGTVGGNISTLTLDGYFYFKVDPATLSVETVPEPATLSLLALGGLALVRRRRKA